MEETFQSLRVIGHLDLDAFYVSCERELNPSELLGVPVAVSQYNPFGSLEDVASEEAERRLVARPSLGSADGKTATKNNNGSLIAVSYEARADGVRRNDRGLEAVRKCAVLRIVQVPVKHGKADLTMYRAASQRVMDVLTASIQAFVRRMLGDAGDGGRSCRFKVEKASIDEIYLDLTLPATELRTRIREDPSLWEQLRQTTQLHRLTTVAGVELVTDAARAENSLTKEQHRRGSHLQQHQHLHNDGAHQICAQPVPASIDPGSRIWWDRPLLEWTDVELALACGAAVLARARAAVSETVRPPQCRHGPPIFTLSGGVSCNKTLAKLASGLKKPNRQTIINPLDKAALEKLFHPLPIGRLRGLGGKFGVELQTKLKVDTVGDLSKVPLSVIQDTFPTLASCNSATENTGSERSFTAKNLYLLARGVCLDEVADRIKPKSISCGKTFRRQLNISVHDDATIRRWVEELSSELTERARNDADQFQRKPQLLVVALSLDAPVVGSRMTTSRSSKVPRSWNLYSEAALQLCHQIIKGARFGTAPRAITGMTVTATSFVDCPNDKRSISALFASPLSPKPQKLDTPLKETNIVNHVEGFAGDTESTVDEISSSTQIVESRSMNECASKPESTDLAVSLDQRRNRLDTGTGRTIKTPKIDCKVLSELRSELRIAAAAAAAKNKKSSSEDRSKACMLRWLKSRTSGETSGKGSLGRKRKLAFGGSSTTSQCFSPPQKTGRNAPPTSPEPRLPFAKKDLDLSFLNELPDDLRASVLSDIEQYGPVVRGGKYP